MDLATSPADPAYECFDCGKGLWKNYEKWEWRWLERGPYHRAEPVCLACISKAEDGEP